MTAKAASPRPPSPGKAETDRQRPAVIQLPKLARPSQSLSTPCVPTPVASARAPAPPTRHRWPSAADISFTKEERVPTAAGAQGPLQQTRGARAVAPT